MSEMTEIETEQFVWAYQLVRTDIQDAPPIQYFIRLADARRVAKEMSAAYPEIPLQIFHRGDQLWLGNPAIHELVH